MTHRPVPLVNRRLARTMRQVMTPAEIRLWLRLKRRELDGVRFRRQAPLGSYIVDFFCPERKLIVELDGDHHGHDCNVIANAERTRWLEGQGYLVLRFANTDVMSNLEGVCATISVAVSARAPLPKPPLAV